MSLKKDIILKFLQNKVLTELVPVYGIEAFHVIKMPILTTDANSNIIWDNDE